jgi:NADH-quinone oxidoreductase subunit J
MNEQMIFYVLAIFTLVSAIGVILNKNPVVSAISLILHLLSIAGFYALMGAHFVAAIQILVYAGAIMVLFLFVVMLLNLKSDELETPRIPNSERIFLFLTIFAFAMIAGVILKGGMDPRVSESVVTGLDGAESNTYQVGIQLFIKYLWPFELASLLILLAIIGSIVIAKKDKTAKDHA